MAPATWPRSNPICYPVLPEQHRIVARVDEPMSLLDRLAAARDRAARLKAAFARAAARQISEDPEP